jgi:hypothetical protein
MFAPLEGWRHVKVTDHHAQGNPACPAAQRRGLDKPYTPTQHMGLAVWPFFYTLVMLEMSIEVSP